MVLGLGSRSKKDRASTVTQLVELDLHLHEIKPWQGLARPSKAPAAVSLRWSRGERLIGSSRSISPMLASGSELGKIVLGESLQIAVAPNREVLKRAKKSYPDLDNPLVFTLLDINDLKGKPLAQAALDLSALAAISDSKLVAVPFTVSKKVAKGATAYLHLTVQRHQEDKASGFAASSATSVSSRTSDASSVPPLDENTKQMLVAALLSDQEDEGDSGAEDIDSFTDDEEDYKKKNHVPSVPQGLSVPQGNMTLESVASPSNNVHQRTTNPSIQQIVEKGPERVDERLSRHAIASPQPSPVKAAAIAAATAYAKKHTFLTRDTNSYMNDSDDLYLDLDSDEEDEFPSRFSGVVRSQSLLPKGSQTAAGRSQLTSLSGRRAESASNVSTAINTKMTGQTVVEAKVENAADVNASGKVAVVDEVQSKLNGEYKTSINSAVRTISETRVATDGKVGVIEEKAGLKSAVHGTTTESLSTPSLTKERIVSSMLPSEPEAFVRTEARNEKTYGDVNISNQSDEVVQAKSSVDPEGEAVIKHQAKTSAGMKAKAAVKSPLREKGALGPPKITISRSPDQMKGTAYQSPVQGWKTLKSTIQEGKAKSSKSPDRNNDKADKKVSEEARQKMSHAEAKAAGSENRIQHLEAEVQKLKGELRDVAVVEAALYSTTAEHGSSSMKLHAPARRLARTYIYACKHWSQERRASCARNTMAGLVLVARACGNDVPRLTFWWSNATVLREIISTAFNVLPASPKVVTMTHSSSQSERKNITSSLNDKKRYQQQQAASPSHDYEDWREPSTFTSALERLESWIYTKVVESIWWQVLTPQMQQPIHEIASEIDDNGLDKRLDVVKHEKRVINSDVEDARQGNISVEIWKKAFLDAYERLCPVRRLGVECGCLPMLNKLVLEACVVRLDVAMFNAILRDDEVPTDPVSDPISDVRVLPIPNSSLSFGLGAQLKNAVATLSSFLLNLMSKDDENIMSVGNLDDDDEKNVIMFPLLKAMGGLLMLPKEMLIDKSLRKEVCPTLHLPFIGRILSKFQPDEFSPEPITPELLYTINAEVAAESQKQGEMDDSVTTLRVACAPSVMYCPPQSSMVRHWIGDAASPNNHFGRSNSSVLRKGHTSDDEIDELESPMSWLLENTTGFSGLNRSNNGKRGAINTPKDAGSNCRFMLLREVWNSG